MNYFFSIFQVIIKFNFNRKKLSIYTLVSIFSILLATFSLMLITSIMDGFRQHIVNQLIKVNGPIQVQLLHNNSLYPDYFTELNPKVMAASEYIENILIYQKNAQVSLFSMQGIDIEAEDKVTGFKDMLTEFESFTENTVIIGSLISDQHFLNIGDSIDLIHPINFDKKRFKVGGIYDSGLSFYDGNLIFIPLKTAQSFLKSENIFSHYKLRIKDPQETRLVKQTLLENPQQPFFVSTWEESNNALLQTIATERKMMTLILSILLLLSGFSIITSLSLQVIEKKKQIGILRTMGLKRSQIVCVFLFQALGINLIAQSFGLILGCIAAFHINAILDFFEKGLKITLFPDSMYYLSSIPVSIELNNIVYIAGFGLLLSIFSAYLPIQKALKIDPIFHIKS